MLKKLLSSTSFALLILLSFNNANAIPYQSMYAPNNSQYSASKDPSYSIMDAVSKLKNFSSNTANVPPALIRGFVENEIIPLFDFGSMARWITGPYVQYMSSADQTEFFTNLKETFLSSLSNHLGSFDADNTDVRYYPARYKRNGEASVSVRVARPGKYPARLDFRMKRDGNDWKIIDVKANGTSAVMHYRNHFMGQLRQYRN